jgi:TonB-dependent SusC/RagA subfamily outer membrane receptor
VGTVLLSLVLPLLDLQWFTITSPDAEPVQQVVQYIYNPHALASEHTALGWEQILSLVLITVSIVLISFFLYGIFKLYRIKAKGKITVMERFDFIETVLDEAPFSFFRNLFWRKDLPVHDETGQRMLKHELTHIEQYHSYDKLFVAFATYLFWVNPFFWLIKKELEVVHEFIADEEAVAGDDAAVLAEMLLKAHYHSNSLSVGQSFFYSSIKRRIIMLTSSKKVSYSYARRLLILPVAIGVLVLLSFTIKDSLSDAQNKQMDQVAIEASNLDTVPAKYRDPKTGQIKGSFQIDIDGEMASFKDIKSKKELFKLPLNELAGLSNKKVSAEGSPLYTEKKIMFISADSMSEGTTYITTPDAIRLRGGTDGSKISRIIINGKEISPADLDKIDPSLIKTIDIRGAEKGVTVSGQKINGMTWSEATSADGKKIVTVKVDSVMFDGKAKVAVPAQGDVKFTEILADTIAFKAISDSKKKGNVSTIVIKTNVDDVAEKAQKDPKTLTFTTTEKDGKKTITYVQKSTEKTELPKDVLYIIDGKEMASGSMNDVNPNTIQSINVLKGESAVKLYGEKGKNGVIVITTKKN